MKDFYLEEKIKNRNMDIMDKLKKRKIPIVRIDKSLNKFDDKVLFPKKLEKANVILEEKGLPKKWVTK
jgi:hypothetical protein